MSGTSDFPVAQQMLDNEGNLDKDTMLLKSFYSLRMFNGMYLSWVCDGASTSHEDALPVHDRLTLE